MPEIRFGFLLRAIAALAKLRDSLVARTRLDIDYKALLVRGADDPPARECWSGS
jgi:hypothetical protein